MKPAKTASGQVWEWHKKRYESIVLLLSVNYCDDDEQFQYDVIELYEGKKYNAVPYTIEESNLWMRIA